MDDYISRQGAIKSLYNEIIKRRLLDDVNDGMLDEFDTESVLRKVPSEDVQPVIRCKDCKWSDWYTAVDGKQYCYCMETGASARTETDYCSLGERRDGEQNGSIE